MPFDPPIAGQTPLDDISGLRDQSIKTTSQFNAAEAGYRVPLPGVTAGWDCWVPLLDRLRQAVSSLSLSLSLSLFFFPSSALSTHKTSPD